MGYREGDFPAAESVAREVLSLPLYPELEDADVHATAETILRCLKG
jgi:dTDP-4-amino-4,6-dideoxygalactose transaminase